MFYRLATVTLKSRCARGATTRFRIVDTLTSLASARILVFVLRHNRILAPHPALRAAGALGSDPSKTRVVARRQHCFRVST